MKKISMLILIVSLVIGYGCSQKVNIDKNYSDSTSGKSIFGTMTKSAGYQVFDVVAAETGYVTNYGVVNTAVNGAWYVNGTPSMNDALKVGKNGSLFTASTYKTILTFDTSSIPQDAVITSVYLGMQWCFEEGQCVEGAGDYMQSHLVYEFAPTTGFGGSTTITYMDYSAYAAMLVGAANMTFIDADSYHRMIQEFPSWAFPYVNKSGKTQLRMSLNVQPSYVVDMVGWFSGTSTRPVLEVHWQ